MNVDFTIDFRGGRGTASVELSNAGRKIGPHTFSESGTWQIDLPEDIYIIKLNGVSPPDGTTFTVSQPTIPPTPDHFDVGPFRRNYTLDLKEKK